MVEKIVTDIVRTTAKVVETGVKKAWSIIDAAVEKKAPSEALSKKGIGAIQGKVIGT